MLINFFLQKLVKLLTNVGKRQAVLVQCRHFSAGASFKVHVHCMLWKDMVFNTTFNNISVISYRSVLLT